MPTRYAPVHGKSVGRPVLAAPEAVLQVDGALVGLHRGQRAQWRVAAGIIACQLVEPVEGIVVVLVLQLYFIGGLDIHDVVEPVHQVGAEVVTQAVVGLAVGVAVAVVGCGCGQRGVVEKVMRESLGLGRPVVQACREVEGCHHILGQVLAEVDVVVDCQLVDLFQLAVEQTVGSNAPQQVASRLPAYGVDERCGTAHIVLGVLVEGSRHHCLPVARALPGE